MNWYAIFTLKLLGLAWDVKRVRLAELAELEARQPVLS